VIQRALEDGTDHSVDGSAVRKLHSLALVRARVRLFVGVHIAAGAVLYISLAVRGLFVSASDVTARQRHGARLGVVLALRLEGQPDEAAKFIPEKSPQWARLTSSAVIAIPHIYCCTGA